MGAVSGALGAVLVLALSATQLSCNVNDYCLNCGTEDGGNGSGDGDANDGGNGSDDARPDAACVPTGVEECNGLDDDCNGLVDDGDIDTVGDLCTEQDGACSGGTIFCDPITESLKCTKVPTAERCDNIDNNCNVSIDEGDPEGGGKCGTAVGACKQGTELCTGGVLVCDGEETGGPEDCDGVDDDCDGVIDNGTFNLGECGPIALHNIGICRKAPIVCIGGVATCSDTAVFPKGFETCNLLDDTCNGVVDEGFNTNTDANNCGGCAGLGGVDCPDASQTCSNATDPKNPPLCSVGTPCTGVQGPCVVNSTPRCTGGNCGIRCNVGFINLNGDLTDGCEYKCSPTGNEECDGVDNDCDGNLDVLPGNVALTPPPNLCLTAGVCAGTAPVCLNSAGWDCPYPIATYQDPEVSCDELNNDCDANIDEEHQPDNAGNVKDTACDDGGVGVCRDFGTYECNPAARTGNLICITTTNAPDPGDLDEDCNAQDDDCDGDVDEELASGQDWVDIGGGRQMMRFEASRPDATDTSAGINESIVCSDQNKRPWTNVTYLEAEAECAAVGARLCTEQEWHRTCSDVPSTLPVAVNNAGTLFEAEDYSAIDGESGAGCATLNVADEDGDGVVNDGCPTVGLRETVCSGSGDEDGDTFANDGCPTVAPSTRAWVPDYTAPRNEVTLTTSDFSGISALEATPNSGTTVLVANVATAPRLDYVLPFTAAATGVHVWVRMFANTTSDDTIHVRLNGVTTTVTALAPPTCTYPSNVGCTAGSQCIDTLGGGQDFCTPVWQWRDAGLFNNVAISTQMLSLFMGDDGVKVDQVYVVAGAGVPPNTLTSKGNTWAYLPSSTASTYAAATCNGADRVAGNADDLVATGSLLSCAAEVGTNVFDLSGNVKEWTVARQPGENPLRGGASNNNAVGISCAQNFTLANDELVLPNIGFRCCR